jgi:hypothetical protein
MMIDGKAHIVRVLARALVSLQASIDKNTSAIREQREAASHANEPPPAPISNPEINLPSAIPAYYEAEQRERPSKNVWERIKRGVEFLTLGIAIVLAILTGKTLQQVQRQADSVQDQVGIMQRQMKLEQRAWIIVKYPTIPLYDGKPIAVPLAMENIGKTLAKHIRGDIAVYITKAKEDPDLNYSPGHTHYSFGPTGTFIPNVPDVMNWIAIRNGEQIVLTPNMHTAILDGRSLVTIHGKIEYQDIFGDSHWLTFCQETGGGTMRASSSDKCAAYNDTDEQDKAKK